MALKLKIYMKLNIMNVELLSIPPSLDSYNPGNKDEEFGILSSGEEKRPKETVIGYSMKPEQSFSDFTIVKPHPLPRHTELPGSILF